jgi:Tfp pilus assembly protein PilO
MNAQRGNFLKLNYLLVVIGVVLVVTTIYFHSARQSAKHDQSKLEANVKTAQIRLIQAQKGADVTSLQQKLASLESQISSSSTYFPQQVSWADLGSNLEASADRHSLQLVNLTPNIGAGTEKFDTRAYPESELALSLEGNLNDICAFLYDLGRDPFPALRVDNLALTPVKDTGSWTLQLTLVILTQSQSSLVTQQTSLVTQQTSLVTQQK